MTLLYWVCWAALNTQNDILTREAEGEASNKLIDSSHSDKPYTFYSLQHCEQDINPKFFSKFFSKIYSELNFEKKIIKIKSKKILSVQILSSHFAVRKNTLRHCKQQVNFDIFRNHYKFYWIVTKFEKNNNKSYSTTFRNQNKIYSE